MQKNLKLQDSEARYKYTMDGLQKVLDRHMFNSIIICDSSNYDFTSTTLELMLQSYHVKYELLHFTGDFVKTQEKGKGYGEGEIMRYIFQNSLLIQSESSFFKITGRLYIDNLEDVINSIQQDNNYFSIVALKFLQALDSRFYKIQVKDFEKSLLSACDYVNDSTGNWYEVVFRDLIKHNRIKIHQFPVYPIIRGVSGTHGCDTFEKDLPFYCHVLTTKLHIHNSLFSAILLYLSVKIQQICNSIRYASK